VAQFTFNLVPERKVWSVSELTGRISGLLAREFPDIWVEGEVSNSHEAQSGHLYFTLKDAKSQVRCVCFRQHLRLLKFRPEDGLHITVRGSIGVYEPRGEYQVYVDYIEPVGIGALQLAFEQLKKRLADEGLFEPERKKPLPVLPRRIGLITSPRGAAVRDVVRILRRRFPNVHLILYPVRVQGEGAAQEIVKALKHFNATRMTDVLILARGGGSLEDLWAFNEEIVARAIAASEIPVITGVGHETDFTIADFVADVRASTPSAAAELVVQTRQEFDRHIAELLGKMAHEIRYLLSEERHRLRDLMSHPGWRRLEDHLRRYRQQADEFTTRLGTALTARLEKLHRGFTVAQTRIAAFDLRARIAAQRVRIEQRANDLSVRIERFLVAKRKRLERVAVQLEERSPLRVLERGYAIVYDAAGNVLRTVEQVAAGDEIAVQLARGRLAAVVKHKERAKS
jgi:exodeoxyribonuclease VII large subunit